MILLSHAAPSWTQSYLILPDSTNYSIIRLGDTIDIDYSSQTPYPDTANLDIDCDGQTDLQINMYQIPVMNFPPEHHIDIVNLVGDDLEILNDDWFLSAFRSFDTIQLESNADWISSSSWKLLYFHVLSGAHWAGVAGTDSLYVNDMYILFRKRISGEWVYGWINYSGKSWETKLYLRHFAIENEFCTSTAVNPVAALPRILMLYPNPARDELYLVPDPHVVFPVSWSLMDSRGIPVGEGILHFQDNPIHIDAMHLDDGIYFIRFQSGLSGTVMHSRFVVQH